MSSPETNSHYAWYVCFSTFLPSSLLMIFPYSNNVVTSLRAVQINDKKRGNEVTCGEDIGTLVMLLSNAFQVVNEV